MNYIKTGNKWDLIVARRNCILRINLILHGGSLTLKDEIDFKDNQVLTLNYDKQIGVYNSEEHLKKMGLSIVKAIEENPNFIKNNIKKCEEVCKNLVKISEKSSQDENLVIAFKNYMESYHKFSTFMFFPIGIEKIITNKVKEHLKKFLKEEEFQEVFNKITTPPRILDSIREQVDLMKIALKIEENPAIEVELIKKHIEYYGYLYVYNQDENLPSLESYKERLHYLVNNNNKVRAIEEEYNKTNKEFNEIIKKLNISGHILDLIKILREYVYLRSYRLEMLNKSNFLIQPLLIKISKKFNLNLQEVCALTAEDIINLLEIEKRINGYIYLQQGNNYKIFTDNLEEIKEEEFGKEEDYIEVNKIEGLTSCKGKVIGKVRVILKKEEISILQKGEILVTSMTTPEYIVAMEKSAAIITDEGGVLCHAAIVSREMNIPCVIGTKIATKVLKTGDLIEVDANNGLIKIL